MSTQQFFKPKTTTSPASACNLPSMIGSFLIIVPPKPLNQIHCVPTVGNSYIAFDIPGIWSDKTRNQKFYIALLFSKLYILMYMRRFLWIINLLNLRLAYSRYNTTWKTIISSRHTKFMCILVHIIHNCVM